MRISINPITTLQPPLRNMSHEAGLIIDARAKIFQRVTSRRRSIGESGPMATPSQVIASAQQADDLLRATNRRERIPRCLTICKFA